MIRSESAPDGWCYKDADAANRIVARIVFLCLTLDKQGAIFSIENLFGSQLWLLRVVQRLLQIREFELVLIHQCAYGSPILKPTGILTTAPWMKVVRKLCNDVGFHRHLKNSFSGLVGDYLTERIFWVTSLAAEYPCGLCFAWAQAL